MSPKRLSKSPRQADRRTVSRVLMVHLEVSGDQIVHYEKYEGSIEGFVDRQRTDDRADVTSDKRHSRK